MSSVPISIREAKEPVNSGRPYLKLSEKEEGKKEKPESAKAKRREKANARKKVRQERSSKSSLRDMVPGHMGTQYYQNTSQKKF